MNSPSDAMSKAISDWISKRVNDLVAEEIAEAKKRLDARIPELSAELGVRISEFIKSATDTEAVLQILIRPRWR